MMNNLGSRVSEVTIQNQPHWCGRCGLNHTAQYKRSGRNTMIAVCCKACMALNPAWKLDRMGRQILPKKTYRRTTR